MTEFSYETQQRFIMNRGHADILYQHAPIQQAPSLGEQHNHQKPPYPYSITAH